jgi:7-carboxy-7-deazaguanine synthase
MTLIVNEIFYSIQGESTYAGRPCAFIRLTGCNLRCTYCDTTYAYDGGVEMELADILNRIGRYRCRLVEITGGEPLLQDQTPQLIQKLLDQGYEVLMETNGSLDIDTVNPKCHRIIDIKCPFSGQSEQNDWDNLKRLTSLDQVKFVIGDSQDYQFAKTKLSLLPPDLPAGQILFSPVAEKMPPALLAEWILSDHLPVRLQLQLHRIIWPDKPRGV